MAVDDAPKLPVLGTLPATWKIAELGALFENGTRNGIYKPAEFHGSGTKMVNMGELFAHPRLKSVPMRRVELTKDEAERFGLRVGDLLFARRSLVAAGAGKCSVVLEIDEPTAFESSLIRARPDAKAADSLYLYYLFASSFGVYALQSILRQVAVSGITGADLVRLQIPVPPLAEQRAIAHILGTLDDNVELNRRMNETLEAMARAIFKSWFVDFDPVRAKAEGHQPVGLDSETAALFPDSFEDSPLGKIPKAWAVRNLDEIAHFLNGLALQKYPPDGKESLPVIKIAQLRKGDTEGADEAAADLPPEYVVQDGDVLFSWSGSLEIVIWCGGRGALNQHLFKVTSKDCPKWFCYFWILEHLSDFQAIASGKATTMGHIQRHHLTEAKVLAPPAELVRAMDRVLSPVIQAIVANNLQSRTLASIRDTLLPKLLSGEVRVGNVEKSP